MAGLAMTFLLVAVVVIVTPGQDTALTIRNTLLGGRRHGVLTAAGVATGQLVWVVATSVGLAALLVASEPAFLALRVVGAAYLVWLGARSLAAAVRGARAPEHELARRRTPFRQGVLSNLGNPKMAVFFTSLLPQFAHSFGALLAHGLVFCALTLAWLSLVARVGSVLRRPRLRRVVDAVTGAVLVALGLRLAGERR
jgi:threonine/homoserine/homoserine lactone efflux protein